MTGAGLSPSAARHGEHFQGRNTAYLLTVATEDDNHREGEREDILRTHGEIWTIFIGGRRFSHLIGYGLSASRPPFSFEEAPSPRSTSIDASICSIHGCAICYPHTLQRKRTLLGQTSRSILSIHRTSPVYTQNTTSGVPTLSVLLPPIIRGLPTWRTRRGLRSRVLPPPLLLTNFSRSP